MALKEAKAALRPLGVSINKRACEFAVRIGHASYFTDDIADAVATGKLMADDPREANRLLGHGTEESEAEQEAD